MGTSNYYNDLLVKEIRWFWVFAVMSVLVPIVTSLVPNSIWMEVVSLESYSSKGSWFSRSGSLMAVFALLAESSALRTYQILNPAGFVDEGFSEAKKKYGSQPAWLNRFAFTLMAVGTLIWGYGDMVFS